MLRPVYSNDEASFSHWLAAPASPLLDRINVKGLYFLPIFSLLRCLTTTWPAQLNALSHSTSSRVLAGTSVSIDSVNQGGWALALLARQSQRGDSEESGQVAGHRVLRYVSEVQRGVTPTTKYYSTVADDRCPVRSSHRPLRRRLASPASLSQPSMNVIRSRFTHNTYISSHTFTVHPSQCSTS